MFLLKFKRSNLIGMIYGFILYVLENKKNFGKKKNLKFVIC